MSASTLACRHCGIGRSCGSDSLLPGQVPVQRGWAPACVCVEGGAAGSPLGSISELLESHREMI